MEELDLKDVFDLFWSKKVPIIIITLIFIIIGCVYTFNFVTPMYSASTTLILVTSSSDSSATNTVTATDLSLNSQLVSTYSELIKSNTVIRQVLKNLNMEIDEDYLKSNITVSSKDETEIIVITVTNENATVAAKIANEIVEVFSEQVKDIYNIDNVSVIDEAEADDEPSNINHPKDIALFTFIGIVVACGYVFIIHLLDTTIKTAEDIEKEYKLPVLASIPVYDVTTSMQVKKGGRK